MQLSVNALLNNGDGKGFKKEQLYSDTTYLHIIAIIRKGKVIREVKLSILFISFVLNLQ